MSKAGLYIKMFVVGAVVCFGGPALVVYVSPTDEELFKRFNPELQKRALETRAQREEEHNNFLRKLKEYSLSDKPIWEAARIDAANEKARAAEEQRRQAIDSQKQRDEIRSEALGGK